MTKTLSRITGAVILFAILFSILSIGCNAANVCTTVKGSGNYGKKTTFYATTNKNWISGKKITLTAKQGTYMLYDETGKHRKSYGWYTVKVTDTKTNKVVLNKKWNNEKTFKIALPKKSRKYKIVVTANTKEQCASHFIRAWEGWVKAPTWSISKTKNITLCKNK